MNLLLVAGEDIDWQGNATLVSSGTVSVRSFARTSVCAALSNQIARSTDTFVGGAVTSCWLTFRLGNDGPNGGQGSRIIGVVNSGTVASGIWVTIAASSASRLGLYKYDSTTMTSLVDGATDLLSGPTQTRFDLQIINYGASGTLNLYANGSLYCTYTGNVAVSGVSNLDCLGLGKPPANSWGVSEVTVADSDSRAIQAVQTMALTGAGTTTGWTNNTFSNINGTTFSDANPTSVNTTTTDQQYNVTDPTMTNYSVIGVKISARMAVSSSPTATQIKLGYNSGGSVAFGTGSTKNPTTGYSTISQIDQTNPITSAAFLQSEMNALQLDLRSA